jgi:hypothetical protein
MIFVIVFFNKYSQDNQIKEDEMGVACNTHWDTGDEYKNLVAKQEGVDYRRQDGRVLYVGLVF